MNILFLHRNFPAQFKHIVKELAKDSNNNIVFITSNIDVQIQEVTKIVYELKREMSKDCHQYLEFYEEAILHAQAALEAALALKQKGFKPDVIYGHDWGVAMFMKDLFPDVPMLCYFEWFYNSEGTDFDFFIKNHTIDEKEKLRCKNSYILTDLYSCDAGISPTNWQKAQFPKEFQDKIKVIHDGIDTDVCKPNENLKGAKFLVKDKNIELSADDEVITYATRGMEPYRGFPNFMKAVEILLKKRLKTHIVIAGEDKVFYGMKLNDKSYKELMLEEFDIDLSRVHFVGHLPFDEYINLLQISSAHIYLTYPFVLSWSVLEAMSMGCCVIASDTQPVAEIVKDKYNGFLFDFFNITQLVKNVEYALDNQYKMQEIRQNARQSIIDNYSLKELLPKHIEFIKSLIV